MLTIFRSEASRGEDIGVVLVGEAPDDRHSRQDRGQERGGDQAGLELPPHVAHVIGLAYVTFKRVNSCLTNTRNFHTCLCQDL